MDKRYVKILLYIVCLYIIMIMCGCGQVGSDEIKDEYFISKTREAIPVYIKITRRSSHRLAGEIIDESLDKLIAQYTFAELSGDCQMTANDLKSYYEVIDVALLVEPQYNQDSRWLCKLLPLDKPTN